MIKNILRFVIYTISSFIIISFFTFLYFKDSFNTFYDKESKIIELKISAFEKKIKTLILNNNIKEVNKEIDKLFKNKEIELIQLKFKNNIFNIETLYLKDNKIKREDALNQISMDAKYGTIERIDNGLYNIFINKLIDNKKVVIYTEFLGDFDIYKKKFNLNFKIKKRKKESIININTPYWFKYFFFKPFKKIYKGKIQANNQYDILEITYKLNYNSIFNDIYKDFLILFYTLLFYYFSFILLYILFSLYMFRKNIIIPYKTINNKIVEANKNKINKINFNDFGFLHQITIQNIEKINSLIKQKNKILKDLSFYRTQLEQKLILDELTGLPNKKHFDLDLENIFISKEDNVFVGILKINNINDFIKINGSEKTDDFLYDISKSIQNSIFKHNRKNTALYRFFGGEFAIIIKRINEKDLKTLLEHILKDIEDIQEIYNLENGFFHISFVPFDKYGSLNSILKECYITYRNILRENQTINNFGIISLANKNKEQGKVVKTVIDIIKNKAFSISFRFNLFSFSDTKNIYMQEVKPLVLNYNEKEIPLSIFTNIAKDKELIIEFDKDVILKTILLIEFKNIEHLIAINISFEAISSIQFITWLEGILYKTKHETLKKIVFSINTIDINKDYNNIVEFIKSIKQFNSKILIKNYDKKYLSYNKLLEFNFDFIKLDFDLCNNINVIKKRDILTLNNYAIDNNFIVFGDNILLEKDIIILESIGIFGANKIKDTETIKQFNNISNNYVSYFNLKTHYNLNIIKDKFTKNSIEYIEKTNISDKLIINYEYNNLIEYNFFNEFIHSFKPIFNLLFNIKIYYNLISARSILYQEKIQNNISYHFNKIDEEILVNKFLFDVSNIEFKTEEDEDEIIDENEIEEIIVKEDKTINKTNYIEVNKNEINKQKLINSIFSKTLKSEDKIYKYLYFKNKILTDFNINETMFVFNKQFNNISNIVFKYNLDNKHISEDLSNIFSSFNNDYLYKKGKL